MTLPPTTILGADPTSTAVPVGVITFPLTTLGAIPTTLIDPTPGILALSVLGAIPVTVKFAVPGILPLSVLGAIPDATIAPDCVTIPKPTIGA
jgi:hypothetical protein